MNDTVNNTKRSTSKQALIIIDVQVDFTTGSLSNPDATDKVAGIVSKAASFDGLVFLTQDTHSANYLETNEGHNLPVEHCIKGTDGWQLSPALYDLVQNQGWTIFEKPTFGSVDLAKEVASLYQNDTIDSVVLVGFCTDICVVSNALLLKAFVPELQVSVVESLCSGTSREAHEAALQTMQSCQVDVIAS